MRSVLVILCLVAWGTADAASSSGFKPTPNPEWCHSGYRCLTIDDYARMTEIKISLEEALKKAKASSRHFGLGCTLGPGFGLVVDEDLTTKVVPSAVGLNCGLTGKF